MRDVIPKQDDSGLILYDDLFDIFIDKFAKTVNNHAPLRKATRKESRLKSNTSGNA